jgi:hypothetical protein
MLVCDGGHSGSVEQAAACFVWGQRLKPCPTRIRSFHRTLQRESLALQGTAAINMRRWERAAKKCLWLPGLGAWWLLGVRELQERWGHVVALGIKCVCDGWQGSHVSWFGLGILRTPLWKAQE